MNYEFRVSFAHTHCRGDSRIARGSIMIDPYLLSEAKPSNLNSSFIIYHSSFYFTLVISAYLYGSRVIFSAPLTSPSRV